jgi:hypothetical protein|tara:strand:- start:5520 stop:6401 length:882 start_codon:yes stop_codon:yes gene_type:complete
MAKKKKTLSDMVKAPRTIDINGQKHMLAWITPKEGKTLKALGGAGTPGPMGLPAFFFGDPGENPEAYSSESFTPSEPSEPRQVSAADFIGSGDEDDDQSQQQDQALANFLSSKNEEDRSWVENKFIKDVQKGKTVGMYQFDPRGRMTGYTHSTNPLGLGGILASLGGGTPMAYTGFGENPFASPEEDDGERRRTDGPASPSDPDKPAESGEMTQAQKDYYAKGIGPSTNIPGSEQDIYKSLIGSSESPIGSRFDREKGLLYLPDGRIIDIKTGKEVKTMSGLDIFKPVSTVTA